LLASLRHWADMAPAYGLPSPDCGALNAALAGGDGAAVDRAADALALQLARMHALGATPARNRAAWHVVDGDAGIDFASGLRAGMAAGSLDGWYESLQPTHPDFAALRTALAGETDTARRATLVRNLERWRWMPHDLGADYVLVNAAAFTVSVERGGTPVGDWRVIVGKPSSPTPSFAAMVTGVTINPWWDIPANIVAESVGSMVRRHPALARARGYVWGGGRYRQRPGPGNALGAMKLAMANGFNVYLHDTPTKALFERDVRAFSHGCVRVDKALDFAAALLSPAQDRAAIDAAVAAGRTVTLPLPQRMPVYIAYFTATRGADGRIMILPDIYGRDAPLGDAVVEQKRCAA
jgi:murein L,D-transpeptidase YcbB/YkuD